MKVLIVSDLRIYALANSYVRAFNKMGYETRGFDILKSIDKYVQYGKIGKKIHTFWPVDAWILKGNRELAVAFRNFMPDLVMVFGNAPVLHGNLAFFKSIKDCKIVLYWPDTLLNLKPYHDHAMKLYDGMATYSKATIPVIEQLGCRKAIWLPFAGDTDLLGEMKKNQSFDCDFSFAGAWRPEREAAIAAVLENFPQLKIQIRGLDWDRYGKNAPIRKLSNATPVYANAFGDFIRKSRINLNVIDDTNFPAANMRFFEVPAAGGLQLSSSCPEMEDRFTDKKDILFYRNQDELIAQVKWVLENPDASNQVRESANAKVMSGETYINRVNDLILNIK